MVNEVSLSFLQLLDEQLAEGVQLSTTVWRPARACYQVSGFVSLTSAAPADIFENLEHRTSDIMTSRDSQEQTTTIPQATLTAYFFVIGVLWVSSFFPEARLWGANWYQYFGWPGQTLLFVVGLVAPWIWFRWSKSAAGLRCVPW